MFEKRLDLALLILRVTFGAFMIINHGWGKLMKFFADAPLKFGDPLGVGVTTSLSLAVFAEVFCAALLVIGLFTRWATIPLIITMAVAAFVVHAGDSFKEIEKALLFLLAYVSILLAGPGTYSLDSVIEQRRMV
jgi:putative oxidoreductase